MHCDAVVISDARSRRVNRKIGAIGKLGICLLLELRDSFA